MQHFKSDDVLMGENYIGCKIDIDKESQSFNMKQPVLVQSLTDEFEDIPWAETPLVLARPVNFLTKCESSDELSTEPYR